MHFLAVTAVAKAAFIQNFGVQLGAAPKNAPTFPAEADAMKALVLREFADGNLQGFGADIKTHSRSIAFFRRR